MNRDDKIIIILVLFMALVFGIIAVNIKLANARPLYYELEPNPYNPVVEATWTNWNITATHGVPKNAVVDVMMSCDVESTGGSWGGMREDGSALGRYIIMPEAEGGGNSTMMWTIQVSSTGLIEYFQNLQVYYDFIPFGYWTGVNFTEKWVQISSGVASGWRVMNLGYGYNSTHMTIAYNEVADGAYELGVREYGSSLERKLLTHESEPVGDETTLMLPAYVGGSGYLETYQQFLTPDLEIMDTGYFSENLGFIESWDIIPVIIADTWTSYDFSDYVNVNGDVVSMQLTHDDRLSEQDLGARELGTNKNRTMNEHEAESNGYAGFGLTVNTNDDGFIELYSSNPNDELYIYSGTFYWKDQPVITIPDRLYGAGFNDTISPYVNLRWRNNDGGLNDNYELQHSTDGIIYSTLIVTPNEVYNHTGLTNGDYHWYRLRTTYYLDGYWYNSSWTEYNLERVLYALGIEGIGADVNVTGYWKYPIVDSISIVDGTYSCGDRDSLDDVDGDIYCVIESVGVPAIDMRFNFTGIDTAYVNINSEMYINHTGSHAHTMHLHAYNFTSESWVEIYNYTHTLDLHWHNASLSFIRNNHLIEDGKLWVSIYIVSAGNINHKVCIDYCRLRVWAPSLNGDGLIWWIGTIFIFVPILLILSYVLGRK